MISACLIPQVFVWFLTFVTKCTIIVALLNKIFCDIWLDFLFQCALNIVLLVSCGWWEGGGEFSVLIPYLCILFSWKFGWGFNLVVWQIDGDTAKLNSANFTSCCLLILSCCKNNMTLFKDTLLERGKRSFQQGLHCYRGKRAVIFWSTRFTVVFLCNTTSMYRASFSASLSLSLLQDNSSLHSDSNCSAVPRTMLLISMGYLIETNLRDYLPVCLVRD